MKKLIIVALLSILSIQVQAKKVVEQTTTDKVITTVSNGIDSGKKAVSDAVNVIDTSSNFKRIYGDVKEGISALASSLKVGAEHVYGVMVKQQVVNAIVWIILLVLSLIGVYVFYRIIKYTLANWADIYKKDLEVGAVLLCIFSGVLLLIFLRVCIGHIDVMVSGIVNPEYQAIIDIANIVRH